MHSRELVQLAGVISYLGPQLIQEQQLTVPRQKLYWTATRSRVQSWNQQFCAPQTWDSIRPILEEILTSEILTRVWCGLSLTYDEVHQTDEFGTIAQSVFLSHQESRNRTMRMMVSGNMVASQDAVRLNKIRRRAERWSDMMLASFLPNESLAHLAFDLDRAEEFAGDLQFSRPDDQRIQMWKVILAGASTSFTTDLDTRSANYALNSQIAQGVLESVPQTVQDSCPFRHLLSADEEAEFTVEGNDWFDRMNSTTHDAQQLVESLLTIDD